MKFPDQFNQTIPNQNKANWGAYTIKIVHKQDRALKRSASRQPSQASKRAKKVMIIITILSKPCNNIKYSLIST
jgi:hypothetical protein